VYNFLINFYKNFECYSWVRIFMVNDIESQLSKKEIDDLNRLIGEFCQGEKRALAKLISAIENTPTLGQYLFSKISELNGFQPLSHSYVIGITGPPGSGKSTLVDSIAKKVAESGKSVGILCVDPTSPFSGGAFLGDRIRMKTSITSNPDIFMRSIASRGISGGLSRAVFDITILFEAFGKDIILIETVGAGQCEVDISEIAYTTIVVSVPGLGDHIQIQKAGILEIADIYVVNKKDLGGDEIAVALDLMLDDFDSLGMERKWRPPVIQTNAITYEGVDDLLAKVWVHKQHLESNGQLNERKKLKLRNKINHILLTAIENHIRSDILTEKDLDDMVNQVFGNQIGLYTAAIGKFKEYLQKNKIDS